MSQAEATPYSRVRFSGHRKYLSHGSACVAVILADIGKRTPRPYYANRANILSKIPRGDSQDHIISCATRCGNVSGPDQGSVVRTAK